MLLSINFINCSFSFKSKIRNKKSYLNNYLRNRNYNRLQKLNKLRSLNRQNPKISPSNIANDIIAHNTIHKVIKNGLNKSPVDLEPNRYHILNKAEHNDDYRNQPTGEAYYPYNTAKPKEEDNYNIYESYLKKNPQIKRNYPKRNPIYQKDKKPYYGFNKYNIRPINTLPEEYMSVPVILMDLDDFKATEEQLDKLKQRLEKAKTYVPQPNPHFYDDESSNEVYDKDPTPYYNPMDLEVENGKIYLEEAIKKVEKMMNKDGSTHPENPPVYVREEPKPLKYQNSSNYDKEITKDTIVKNYYYPSKENDVKKALEEQKAKEEAIVNKLNNKVEEGSEEESEEENEEEDAEEDVINNQSDSASADSESQSTNSSEIGNNSENTNQSNSTNISQPQNNQETQRESNANSLQEQTEINTNTQQAQQETNTNTQQAQETNTNTQQAQETDTNTLQTPQTTQTPVSNNPSNQQPIVATQASPSASSNNLGESIESSLNNSQSQNSANIVDSDSMKKRKNQTKTKSLDKMKTKIVKNEKPQNKIQAATNNSKINMKKMLKKK